MPPFAHHGCHDVQVNRRVYMDHVSFFVYLTDVKDGDGGASPETQTQHTSLVVFYELLC